MNNYSRKIIIHFCILIFCMTATLSAFALENTEEPAEMTVSLVFEESDGKETRRTALQGAEILLYKIASLTNDGSRFIYILEPPFQNSGVDVNSMTAAQSSSATELFYDIIQSDRVSATEEGKTDQNGKIVFQDLEPGMYLGIQKEPVIVNQKTIYFLPSFWMTPEGKQNNDGTITWNRNVSVFPKVSPKIDSDIPPDNPPPPPAKTTTTTTRTTTTRTTTTRATTTRTTTTRTTTRTTKKAATQSGKGSSSRSTGGTVRTGDENKIQVYAGIFIASLAVVLLLFVVRRKKK